MTRPKTKEWLDLVAAIAIVGGLILVAYEIRQANVVANAQAENDIYEGWEAFSMAEIETGINALYVKSIEHPKNLTETELRDISSWLTAVVSLYVRAEITAEFGLVTNADNSTIGPDYFEGDVARAWFDENESWIRLDAPRLADEIARYIETTPLISTDKPNE